MKRRLGSGQRECCSFERGAPWPSCRLWARSSWWNRRRWCCRGARRTCRTWSAAPRRSCPCRSRRSARSWTGSRSSRRRSCSSSGCRDRGTTFSPGLTRRRGRRRRRSHSDFANFADEPSTPSPCPSLSFIQLRPFWSILPSRCDSYQRRIAGPLTPLPFLLLFTILFFFARLRLSVKNESFLNSHCLSVSYLWK